MSGGAAAAPARAGQLQCSPVPISTPVEPSGCAAQKRLPDGGSGDRDRRAAHRRNLTRRSRPPPTRRTRRRAPRSGATATTVSSAPLSWRDLSATNRNTRAGSAPDNSSVPMSRVASIQACRARDCSYSRAFSIAMPAAAASACTRISSSSLNGCPRPSRSGTDCRTPRRGSVRHAEKRPHRRVIGREARLTRGGARYCPAVWVWAHR